MKTNQSQTLMSLQLQILVLKSMNPCSPKQIILFIFKFLQKKASNDTFKINNYKNLFTQNDLKILTQEISFRYPTRDNWLCK